MSSLYHFTFSDPAEILEDMGGDADNFVQYYGSDDDHNDEEEGYGDAEGSDISSIFSEPRSLIENDEAEILKDESREEPEVKRRRQYRHLSEADRLNISFLVRFHEFSGDSRKLNITKVILDTLESIAHFQS